jgi:palmitoyltransferase
LSLTSICHPFLVFRVIGINVLLPDDCGDVFHETE